MADSTDIVEPVWRCAGCGEIAVGFTVKCDCPTRCLYVMESPELGAVKVESGRPDIVEWLLSVHASRAAKNTRFEEAAATITRLRSELEAQRECAEAFEEMRKILGYRYPRDAGPEAIKLLDAPWQRACSALSKLEQEPAS